MVPNLAGRERGHCADDLKLFKLVDDVSQIPADVRAYHDPGAGDGFKRPTAEDTEKAQGEQPT